MPKNKEDLVDERRNGFVTGLAVSELMLLILFALLLFMVEGLVSSKANKDIIDSFGGQDTAVVLSKTINDSPQIKRMLEEEPDILDLWIRLSTSGAFNYATDNSDIISELTRSLEEMVHERESLISLTEQQGEETADLIKRLSAANNALLEGVRKGGTTLCTYLSPTSENPRPRSVPLGIVFLHQDGIVLLSFGFGDAHLIDAYGEEIDAVKALEIIATWGIGKKISYGQFQSINEKLISIGNNYATESRQNCRYYFDYYFVDIDANTLVLWNRLNYSGVKISQSRYLEI